MKAFLVDFVITFTQICLIFTAGVLSYWFVIWEIVWPTWTFVRLAVSAATLTAVFVEIKSPRRSDW